MDHSSHHLGDQVVALEMEELSGESGMWSTGPHLQVWVHT